MEQNQFIENILNSTNGIMKVTPNDDLFFKIQDRISAENYVSVRLLFKIAASIAILIVINRYSLTNSSRNVSNEEMASFEKAININNQLY